MKLYLKNHTERYPVEQLQLQLFAQEPSEFCTEPFAGDGTVSSLAGEALSDGHGEGHVSGEDRLCRKPCAAGQGRCACNAAHFTAQLLSSCFAGASGCAAAWGALSGVRPTKLSTKCLMAGGSEKDAEKLAARGLFCLAGAGKALR